MAYYIGYVLYERIKNEYVIIDYFTNLNKIAKFLKFTYKTVKNIYNGTSRHSERFYIEEREFDINTKEPIEELNPPTVPCNMNPNSPECDSSDSEDYKPKPGYNPPKCYYLCDRNDDRVYFKAKSFKELVSMCGIPFYILYRIYNDEYVEKKHQHLYISRKNNR